MSTVEAGPEVSGDMLTAAAESPASDAGGGTTCAAGGAVSPAAPAVGAGVAVVEGTAACLESRGTITGNGACGPSTNFNPFAVRTLAQSLVEET